LWQTPTAADDIKFNDWNCKYSSKSYYCQPKTIPLVDTTPADGSPDGCACSMLDLKGDYSAGAVLKCTNCLEINTIDSASSCPSGTKLFAPSSQEDWSTFFESGGEPLYDPHWVFDVTRPSNGCGGCTSYPMKSSEPMQSSWRTQDAQTWWLRDSTYSEPNGDYTANCYLDLWSSPKDSGNIIWNDGNCNYRSKSYYCQPTRSDLADLTPADGSPDTCACGLVELSGTMTAGQLVKCENCNSISATGDASSCPSGMKLWAPASRADWEVFFASVGDSGPLYDPYWIIDVTRPANGCGGCTSYAMKSTESNQASWVTQDGEPWWLRDSTYGEPNGDYSANCYLDLWRSPKSADDVVFNDWNCKYSSKSYYCQPEGR